MDEPQRHTHRLYLHSQQGWTPDPDGALLRLDAQLRLRQIPETRNQLYRPDGKGGWIALTDESALSAPERGLVWFGWPTMAKGRQYLAFKGVRVLDEEVAGLLLDGLAVYNENGEVLAEATSAGHIFLLSAKDARLFHKRVKSAGGEVHRGDPMPGAALLAAEVIEQCSLAMERLAAEDAGTVAEAKGDDFSGRAAFERRREQYDTHMQHARAAFDECERALRPLSLAGRSLAEQSQAVVMSERAGHAMTDCGSLYERREAAERELARLVARAEGHLGDKESPAQRLLLFRELGRIARTSGLEVEDTPEGARVLTSHGWLRLGPAFDFEA